MADSRVFSITQYLHIFFKTRLTRTPAKGTISETGIVKITQFER